MLDIRMITEDSKITTDIYRLLPSVVIQSPGALETRDIEDFDAQSQHSDC